MTDIFGPNFAYGYLLVGVIIGFIVGRVTAPKTAPRDVGGGQKPGTFIDDPAKPPAPVDEAGNSVPSGQD